ncbi:hypothetical protein HBB16_18110 [Pseudonocardia sp. MCCB 268]|nr:hypothetical protein [Pseudonocardia cytotoxica]
MGALALFPGLFRAGIVPGLGPGRRDRTPCQHGRRAAHDGLLPSCTGLLGSAGGVDGLFMAWPAASTRSTRSSPTTSTGPYVKRDASDRHYLLVGRSPPWVRSWRRHVRFDCKHHQHLQLLNGLFLVPPFAIFLPRRVLEGARGLRRARRRAGRLPGPVRPYRADVLDLGERTRCRSLAGVVGFRDLGGVHGRRVLLTRRDRLPDRRLQGLV